MFPSSGKMSSSSSKSSSKKKLNSSSRELDSNARLLLLSFPPFNFIQGTPFFRQPLSLNPNLQILSDTSNAAVRAVQRSITTNFEKCVEMLQNLESQNGFLANITSLSSHLLCPFQIQIPSRKLQKLGIPRNLNFAAILPGDSVAGVVVTNGILNFLNIYNTLLVVRLVLTWFPSAPQAIVSPLSTLCDPYLNIFRGLIPPLGGTLDLSPILAFLVLNAFTSTAAALPAELPSADKTSNQKKWIKRTDATHKSATSNGEI